MSVSERHDTIDGLRNIPWVARVSETNRDDATHCVETHLTVIRRDHEVHEIENLGAAHVATSAVGAGPATLYVSV